jgi:hypothetical protein
MSLILITNESTLLGFNPETGLPSVLKIAESNTDYIRETGQPFFEIVLKNEAGDEHRLNGSDAMTARIEQVEEGLIIYYNLLAAKNLWVKCSIRKGTDTAFEFGLDLRNNTGWKIVSVEYPLLFLPAALEGENDWILWDQCIGNGTLIHGFKNAYKTPNKAFDGSFSEPIQMCAVGTTKESLYFCTMDTQHYAKNLQPIWTGKNLKVSNTHCFDEEDYTRFVLPYKAGLSLLNDGEWFAAAEKYRDWAEKQEWTKRKMWEREDTPKWWLDSPIMLSIKERGKRNSDMGQRPSLWCHPLEKGVPRIKELSERFDSPVIVQVFHWEKGGAFINGDHFPPLSGYEGTKRFFDLLHESGNYGGVYILPLKWTLKGHATGFDGSRFFEEQNVMENVCVDQKRNPIRSLYDWSWRKRLFMCAATSEVRKQIVNSFKLFSEMGADFIQFDTFNGRLYDCWSDEHGHYPGPGKWLSEESVSLIEEIIKQSKPFVLTFEGEPVEAMLPLGLGFVERGLQPLAKKGYEKIPLYQFVYHQYTQGFSGENAGSWNTPDNFYLVSAITIISGDMLMINLSEEGKIAMQTHEIDNFDQTIESVYPIDEIEGFIRDLNRIRKTYAREFLVLGRMERSPRIECRIGRILEGDIGHPRNADREWKPEGDTDYNLAIPSVLGSSWTSPEGEKGTILVNYTRDQQEALVVLRYDTGDRVSLIWQDGRVEKKKINNDGFSVTMSPLSAVVIKKG